MPKKFPDYKRVTNRIYEIGEILVYLPQTLWSPRAKHNNREAAIKSYVENAYHDYILYCFSKAK